MATDLLTNVWFPPFLVGLVFICLLDIFRHVEDQNIAFFEEPVSPEFYQQYAELRLRTSIPIAGGECEYLRHGFKTLLDSKSVDIIQVQVV